MSDESSRFTMVEILALRHALLVFQNVVETSDPGRFDPTWPDVANKPQYIAVLASMLAEVEEEYWK